MHQQNDQAIREPQYLRLFRQTLPPILTHPLMIGLIALSRYTLARTPALSIQENLLSEERIPKSHVMTISRINAFFDGVEAITQTLWYRVFWCFFAYDLHRYHYFPNKQYLMTSEDLIWGTAKNYQYQHASLSVNLGGDIPGRLNYWPWLVVMSASLAMGLFNLFKGKAHYSKGLLPIVHSNTRSMLDKLWDDAIRALPFFTSISRQLARVQFEVETMQDEMDEKNDIEIMRRGIEEENDTKKMPDKIRENKYTETISDKIEKKNDAKTIPDKIQDKDQEIMDVQEAKSPLDIIIRAAKTRSFFVKSQAISSLAYLYSTSGSKTVQLKSAGALREIAGNSLSSDPVAWFNANYRLWSIGQSDKILMHLFAYAILMPALFFAQMRLWSLGFNKILGFILFEQDKRKCKQADQIWSYQLVSGNYVCVVCDETYVALKDAFTGQGCLNSLLATPRDPQEIVNKLNAWKNHGPFTVIAFDQQPWPEWPLAAWQKINTVLQSFPYNRATILNLSRADAENVPVPPDWMQVVADFLKKAQIQMIDLTNQLIGQRSMQVLLPALSNNNYIQTINFTGSNLTDDVAGAFLSLLPTMLNLTTLNLGSNQLTGYFITFLNGSLLNTSLTYLDVSNNQFAAEDLEQLGAVTASSTLQTLDVSGQDFSLVNMSRFGSSIANSSLIELYMAATLLNDDQASGLFEYIANSSIQILQWSDNQLYGDALVIIARLLAASRLTRLYIDDNYLDDNAVTSLSSALAGSHSLRALSLSGNRFTSSGFAVLANNLSTSSLQELGVARNYLGDNAIQALIAAEGNNTFLQTLDLSDCGLTGASVNDLFYYISTRSITSLDVSRNSLVDLDSKSLQTAFNGSHLKRISLRGTQIPASTFITAIPALTGSKLEYLDISDNSLGDEVAVPLAGKLLTPAVNFSEHLPCNPEKEVDFQRLLNRSGPTALKQLLCSNAQISNDGINALCEALSPSGIDSGNLVVTNNSFNSSDIKIHGCPVLQTNTVTAESTELPWLKFSEIFMLVCAILLLLKPVRAIYQLSQSSELFSQRHPQPKKIRNMYENISLPHYFR